MPVEEEIPAAASEEGLEAEETESAEEEVPATEEEELAEFRETAPVEEEIPAAESEETTVLDTQPEVTEFPQPEFHPPIREIQPEPFPEMPEEEKLHSDAKRFAKLLVSEIKLYNESRVVEGRENRDIYIRLKRDIDRSREMYEKRVSPVVAQKIDYFHDEIIRILGDNDSSALGSDYPGPRVES